MRKWSRRLLRSVIAGLACVVLLALAAWGLLRGSLPRLDGEAALAGLSAPAQIRRDALGVVTIEAASERDAMRALGYVHAQERYFEMDLLRRTAAGELSALFGPMALDVDRHHRVHRMRARVDARLDAIAGGQRPLLDAYAEGVNAGLSALRVRPWPYLLLRQRPQPWRPADTALAGYAMYFDLQDATNARELAMWTLEPHLPEPLYALLAHPGSDWDAPLTGEPFGDAVLPGADEVDLRRLPAPQARDGAARAGDASRDDAFATRLQPSSNVTAPPLAATQAEAGNGPFAAAPSSPARSDLRPGSNNFAVSGALTADGRAIVADDMHLGLRAPNLWFRARLRWPDARAPGGRVDVQGLTLPGLPAIVAGSNGHVAWGYTNSYADTLDWALERPCTAAGAGAGCSPVTVHAEAIAVAGADSVPFEVRETSWGPVLHDRPDGQVLSLRWTAHLPRSLDLGLMQFAYAASVDDVLAQADRAAIPTQNLVVGDADGDIAWRLLGPVPARSGDCRRRLPARMNDTDMPAPGTRTSTDAEPPSGARARGTIAPSCAPWANVTDAAPVVRSPDADRLWTANARVVSGETLSRIGDGGYALGARQRQIRDALQSGRRFTEADLLALQLDDRALLMTRWRDLLVALAAADDAPPPLRNLATATADWTGRASVDSAGYRIVRAWRQAVHARLLDGLTAPARAALGADFILPDLPQFEGVAWPLVQQRPAHLLPRGFDSWPALFADAAREVDDELSASGPLRARTWGERNTAAICHPLAGAVPLGKRLLCMPADRLPGDAMMPRVQGPSFGASERMVVSPGHEGDGILHMPGGQSGHPLSPFWGAGHDDWVQGRASPFLPGAARHTLVLQP
ncbi:penicillin acylase family protein [Luteimonas kalidii]|uniref:Penicillin acylase family protein n=1 Tax=Luteimonas kalidii TaxID=3042025 RepID=A0ABT6JQH5_9GAMM|nr:penicillin acylase family protein [Luteimonas kalidii]MDH5832930.1 penicillin acylase family protein [Luteimonas kalidii]